MSLDTLVQVTITKQNSQLSRTGFGTALIASYHTNFAARTKLYQATTGLTDLVADGFSASSPTYLAAAALLAQNPQVPTFKVGRRALAFTQIWDVIVKTATDDATYTVTVNGKDASFTAGTATTLTLISAGLKLAIDALGEAVTVVDDLAGTLTITADVVGAYHTIAVSDDVNGRQMWTENKTADPGIATDLAAIQAEDDDWYGLLLDSNGPAEVLAAAAWTETVVKLFGATVADTEILDPVVTTDVMSVAQAAAYARTYLSYSDKEHGFLAAGQMGDRFPADPGSSTWHLKTINGVTVSPLTAAEQAAIDDKSGNYYVAKAGRNVVINGWTPSGEFIDITRGVDWLRVRIQEDVFVTLAAAEKIPYTDDGAAVIEGAILSRLRDAIVKDVLAASPEPTVTTPAVADQNPTDRSNRYFPGIAFGGTLAGAIHTLKIDGFLTV
jgi:hypothetical protein